MEKMNKYIRLTSVKIKNIKNVKYGKIDLPVESNVDKNGLSNVFGIYGPNGSGKTALITAIDMLKKVVSGQNPNTFGMVKYINNIADNALISCTFTCFDDVNNYSFGYDLSLMKSTIFNPQTGNDEYRISIEGETLTYLGSIYEKSQKKFLSVNLSNELSKTSILPAKYYENFFAKSQETESFYNAKFSSTSFVFSLPMLNYLKQHTEFAIFVEMLIEFKKFMTVNLFVIDQGHNNDVFLNVNYRTVHDDSITQMKTSLINYRTVIPTTDFTDYERSIEAANLLLSALVPGIQIKINKSTIIDTLISNNIRAKSFELVSIRSGNVLPLSLESNGIKSLFSIASLLVTAYNDEAITIVIDEFDSGVFEYLLGSILDIYKESGRGLFIFTSHNLRPLEILGKNNIYFTIEQDEEDKNRFVKFPYLQQGSNLRNQYFRTLFLSSVGDEFAYNVKKGDIRKAFFKAIKVYTNEEKGSATNM